ncbi:MAG: DUF4968 domain-containing protein [Anaerolineae bacterium]|nr:DUF4968 domain-containing protein [Anaerolineae bacterium]
MTDTKGFTPVQNGAIIELDRGARLSLAFVAPDILRLRLAPTGAFVDETTFVVEQTDWPTLSASVAEADDGGALTLESEALRVEVARAPFCPARLCAQFGPPDLRLPY